MITKFENNAHTRIIYGLYLIQTDKLKKAVASLTKTAKTFPQNAIAKNVLGLALIGKKKFKNAIPILESAIELDGKLASAHFNLGHAQFLNDQKDEALRRYRILQDIDPILARELYKVIYRDKMVFVEN